MEKTRPASGSEKQTIPKSYTDHHPAERRAKHDNEMQPSECDGGSSLAYKQSAGN